MEKPCPSVDGTVRREVNKLLIWVRGCENKFVPGNPEPGRQPKPKTSEWTVGINLVNRWLRNLKKMLRI